MKLTFAQWTKLMRLPRNLLLSIADLAKIWEVSDVTVRARLRRMGIAPFTLTSTYRPSKGNRQGQCIPSKLYISSAQLHEALTDSYEMEAERCALS